MNSYRDPLKAGLLSVGVPGAGHVYAGQSARGLTYFLGAAVGLFLFVVPGIVIWLAAIGDAVLLTRSRNSRLAPLHLAVEPSPVARLARQAISITDGPAPTPLTHEVPDSRHLPRRTAP